MARPNALHRAFARVRDAARVLMGQQMTRAYSAASPRAFPPEARFAGYASEGLSSPQIETRAKFYAAGNPIAANIVENRTTGEIGTGARPESLHPTQGEAINAAVARWWSQAGAEGRLDFGGIQYTAVREVHVTGGVIVQAFDTPDGLRVRLIPQARLDRSKTQALPGGGEVIGGVEIDIDGRDVALHLYKDAPQSVHLTSLQSVRVSTEDFFYFRFPAGVGAVHGISTLAPSLTAIADFDELIEAMRKNVKVATLLSLLLKYTEGQTDVEFDLEGFKQAVKDGINSAMILALPPGIEPTTLTPQQTQQTAEFCAACIRHIAAGVGLPAHLVDQNLSEASYGSIRVGMIAHNQRTEAVQHIYIAPLFLTPIYRKLIRSLVLRGEIEAPDFESDPEAYYACNWHFCKQPWIDPKSDAVAVRAQLDMGLTSRRRAVAELGWSVEELDREIAADRERETRLGLSFAAPAQAQPSNDDDDKESGDDDQDA